MNLIYLFAILIAVASANIAPDISNIQLSRKKLSCLASKNASKVIFEISDGTGAINKDFLSGYIFARDSGIATVDAIVIANDNLTFGEVSANVTTALPASFNGTVWLKVLNSSNLWSHEAKQRLVYLENLAGSFQQRGVKVGIYSDASTWVTVFGSQGIGSDGLRVFPVWYANENNIQSFDDFSYAGFGTWDKPSIKNYKNNVYVCSSWIASLNFYNE